MTAKPTESNSVVTRRWSHDRDAGHVLPFCRSDDNAAYNLPRCGWPVCSPVRRLSAQFPSDVRGFDRFRVARGAARRLDVASDIRPLPRLYESL